MVTNATLTKLSLSELQRSMERFENFNDGAPLPDTFLIIRLSPRRRGDWGAFAEGFPHSGRATKALLITARSLMISPYRIIMAYLQGEEISLVIEPMGSATIVRRSEIISAFASTAAIEFMKSSGVEASFSIKLSELPSYARCVEYLLWQRRICIRNATHSTLTETLRAQGASPEKAASRLRGLTEEQRVSLLSELGIPLESIPHTKRRGILLFWEPTLTDGIRHSRVNVATALPESDAQFIDLIQSLLTRDPVENQTSSSPSSLTPIVAKTRDNSSPQSPSSESRPSPLPRKRKTKKAQVSVFRVAAN